MALEAIEELIGFRLPAIHVEDDMLVKPVPPTHRARPERAMERPRGRGGPGGPGRGRGEGASAPAGGGAPGGGRRRRSRGPRPAGA